MCYRRYFGIDRRLKFVTSVKEICYFPRPSAFLKEEKRVYLTGILDLCTTSSTKFIFLEVVCAKKLRFQHP